MQKECFQKELGLLRKGKRVKSGNCRNMRLFLDADGLIRCGSRLPLQLETKKKDAPVLVDPGHPFVISYVTSLHRCKNCAAGDSTLNKVRQKVHGPGLKNLVKKVVGQCRQCMRIRASPYRYPEQPVIPIERTLAEIPFAITGVDYSGPHEIREGYERVKVWVCLFTCLVSRAVYLVLVKDITSLTFLAALQELICRRGRPKMLVSDNATTFTHTCKMLKEISQVAEVVNELANEGIEWRFIPAKAPWFGGIYERLIGIMKKELAKMYDGTVFTEFQVRNHLYEIEKVMNNRPLTCVGANEVITPAHILFGATAKLDDIFSSFNSDGIVENALRARKELPKVYRESEEDRSFLEGPSKSVFGYTTLL